MIYGSICSGIEAASVAWHPLGWRAAFLSEIEPFPRAVLQHHYPDVPLHGDFTTIHVGDYAAIDLLVGGTPCQSFSVAGLRKGLDDDRGNLALEYLRLADRLRPRWLVWENVPGVLSSNGGRDFGSILGGMVELGYGFAYRVLDAQYVRVDGFERAVPQRRRRVFVVGYLGDWRRAAAVLFERESLCGNAAPRREAGKISATTLAARTRGGGGLGTDFDCDGGLIPLNSVDGCSHALAASRGGAKALDATMETYVGNVAGALTNAGGNAAGSATNQDAFAGHLVAFGGNNSGPIDVATAQTAHGGRMDFESETFVAHSLRADGFDASEDGTGRGTPLVPVCFDETQITSRENRCNPLPGDPSHPLVKGGRAPTIAFSAKDHGADAMVGVSPTLRAGGHNESHANAGVMPAVLTDWRVRRLTPRECARLQGFPDDYLDISHRGKPAADGPKYKALGNSMAVNVMRWIGRRIEMAGSIEMAA